MCNMSERAHIIFTDRQKARLVDESLRTGLSMCELVRRAVDAAYRPGSRTTVHGFELSLGLWREPDAAIVGRRPQGRRRLDGR
jgi:hypothetical protein